jgi:FMN phosphatase YigB (HAD superfamily)
MKQLYIFDLDDTLYLRTPMYSSRILYEECLKRCLLKLKNNNKILAIASHNSNPEKYLHKMGILHLFSYIIGEYPRQKDTMVAEILQHTGVSIQNTVFFDDLEQNCYIVSKMGVDVVKAHRVWGLSEMVGFDYKAHNV